MFISTRGKRKLEVIGAGRAVGTQAEQGCNENVRGRQESKQSSHHHFAARSIRKCNTSAIIVRL